MKKLLLKNINQLATFKGKKAKHGKEMSDIYLLNDCCVLIEDEKIADIFPSQKLALYADKDVEIVDCSGKLVTAGYVDCHTHFVFAGDRSDEFNMRLNGIPYMEIMAKGGGIVKTVDATRKASEETLIKLSLSRIKKALSYGVTTLEAKSGYGLDTETELKQLRVANKLNNLQPVEVVSTFMGAHAVPKDFSSEKYINYLIDEMLPAVTKENLADFCDCFCEKGVFDAAQCKKILTAAKLYGLKPKIHAEEINRIGGADLACELGAISCEHLLKITDKDINRLGKSETIGVILPATAFSLKENYAPARKMIDADCALAVASDFNPGSCNTQSIPLIIALSNIYCNMTIAETLCALTINAACAIDRGGSRGTVEVGKNADLIIHNLSSLNELNYNFATNSVEKVIKKGKVVFEKDY